MKNLWNISRIITVLLLCLCSTSVFYAQENIDDAELALLLKDIEKMVGEMEQEQKDTPAPILEEKHAPRSQTTKKASLEKKVERKDPRTNFLENFQPTKPATSTRLGEKKEEVTLPDFKREALEAYFSAFLINLLDVRKKASSVDIYRRTKTFAPYIDQLNELETLMWEILNTSAYHIPFYSSQFSSLRSHILQAGKDLERSNRAFKMPETQEAIITTREEFERLKPEKATEKVELKKLTKVFSLHLEPLITDFRKVVSAAGKNIEEVKKKYTAEERTAERHRKDLESRASRYRPSGYSGPSFWDAPSTRYGEDVGGGFGGDFDGGFGGGVPGFGSDMFPFGEGDGALFPGAEEGEYETGLPAEGDQGKIENEGKERIRKSKENAQESNFKREGELKKGIISLVDQAQSALGDSDEPSEEQKANARELVESIKKHMSELPFIQASLHEDRKKNKAWIDLDNRYQKATQEFKEVSERIGISRKETEDFLRQTKSIEQQQRETSQELDGKQQRAIDELKKNNGVENLKFFAKTILKRNNNDVDKNILKLNESEATTLQELSGLDEKSDPEYLNQVLKKSTIILPHLNAVKDVLNIQESKKLNQLIEQIEAIEEVVKESIREAFEKPLMEAMKEANV